MKQHYDDICDYIKHYSQFIKNRYYKYELVNVNWRLRDALSDDDRLVIRAAYIHDIPPLKSKLDYKNILDFRVHIILLKLQNELLDIDADCIHDVIIYNWIKKRRINILNKMNQIRVKFDYKESFDI